MKGGYEHVGGAIDMMQPHEPWDYTTTSSSNSSHVVGLMQQHSNSTSNHNTFPIPKPQIVDNKFNMNLERPNDLSEWVENVTRQLLDDLPEYSSPTQHDHHRQHHAFHQPTTNNIISHDPIQDPTSILASHDFRPRKALKRSGGFDVDGSGSHNNDQEDQSYYPQWNQLLGTQATNNGEGSSSGSASSGTGSISVDDQNGMALLSQLLECAVAISIDNIGEAHRMVLELTQMASPYSASCAERVVAYFAKAMSSRVINSWLGICTPLLDHKTIHSSFQLFNNVAPFIKFAHFTSNQAILEAFQRRDRVHIIDVDIMQGLQWPALFHILASRMEGPPHVRLTGLGSSMELLIETGKQLSNFAKRLGLSFEFNPIAKKFGDIDISMIQARRGETLAVHWLQHSLYDATGADMKTMRLLQQLSPRVITLVEQDISQGGSFLDRFVSSLHYYSTLFDSVGAYLTSENSTRHQVEQGLLYREINNILAIGGPSRSGEDKFGKWRSELEKSNTFVQVPMSTNSMAQAHLILNMFPPTHGYTLVQGDGTLRLGWKDTSLFTASAWTWTSPHH